MVTAKQLADIARCTFAFAQQWTEALNAAMDRFAITTPRRQAMFLAQTLHESCRLMRLSENFNYSAGRLLVVFGKYFSEEEAGSFAHRPEAIANRVYANRFGNGDEASGDGFRYRGRGLIQLTFKDNYLACGEALKTDLVSYPALLAQPKMAALSAAWYWHSHGCNEMADAGDFEGVTRAINGGLNGLDDRLALYEAAETVLQHKTQ